MKAKVSIHLHKPVSCQCGALAPAGWPAPHPTSFFPFSPLPPPSLPYLPSSAVTSLPLPFLSLPPLRSRPFKSSQGVWGSPSRNRIWCVLALKSDICFFWCADLSPKRLSPKRFVTQTTGDPTDQLPVVLRNNEISCRMHDSVFCNNQLPHHRAPQMHGAPGTVPWCHPLKTGLHLQFENVEQHRSPSTITTILSC